MKRIFISYSHKDAAAVAEWLYIRLTGCGYSVFKDDHNLKLGHSFPEQLSNGVEEGDHFLVLLSAAALQSDWMNEEIEMAKVAQRHIIPIVLDDLEIPLKLRILQCQEMKARENDWRALHKLVNGLEGGDKIPRVYNLCGYDDIEVEGVLVLDHSHFGLADLKNPESVRENAIQLAEAALPYIKEARAGIVTPGHPAVAASVLAYLMGIDSQMPRLYYTSRQESGKFGIHKDRYLELQEIRELGFERRKGRP